MSIAINSSREGNLFWSFLTSKKGRLRSEIPVGTSTEDQSIEGSAWVGAGGGGLGAWGDCWEETSGNTMALQSIEGTIGAAGVSVVSISVVTGAVAVGADGADGTGTRIVLQSISGSMGVFESPGLGGLLAIRFVG